MEEVTTPVVALTANIMYNDLQIYKSSGMLDYLGKPFTSQELWKCLIKHLPVIKYDSEDKDKQSGNEEKSLKQIQAYFEKNNQTTFVDINQALEHGDITLAYRLAHNLKGNAGQIGEKQLQAAAAVIESTLSDGKNTVTEVQMKILETELSSVLEKLSPLINKSKPKKKVKIADAEETMELFKVLEPLLKNRKPECMYLLDEIRTIPDSDELANYIEDFEFLQALTALAKLKETLAGN